MDIKDFFRNYGLRTSNIEVKQSSNCYAGTDDPILYINLDKEVDGQDYLVMSHTLATKVAQDINELTSASVTCTEAGWGLISHSTVTVLGTVSL